MGARGARLPEPAGRRASAPLAPPRRGAAAHVRSTCRGLWARALAGQLHRLPERPRARRRGRLCVRRRARLRHDAAPRANARALFRAVPRTCADGRTARSRSPVGRAAGGACAVGAAVCGCAHARALAARARACAGRCRAGRCGHNWRHAASRVHRHRIAELLAHALGRAPRRPRRRTTRSAPSRHRRVRACRECGQRRDRAPRRAGAGGEVRVLAACVGGGVCGVHGAAFRIRRALVRTNAALAQR
mmetsp:Transcript_14777/g.34416  ORF Transcript_14777/g.34416 Transcript_14777/m.34416 type:complete len:247 (+) Transcript_14777:181-921(+)